MHNRALPKAKVKYFVKAVLDDMKHKQVLIIREPPVGFKTGSGISETSHIKTLCVMDQGHSTLTANFEKNVYTP